MNRERIGQTIFAAAALTALLLYWLTAPDGLPWNDSTHLAVAYLGKTLPYPVMQHQIWGRFVQVFGGNVVLACVMAALAGGMLGSIVNRHFGWRVGIAASLVWMFMPGVWNSAITGERSVVLSSVVIAVVWLVDVALLGGLARLRKRAGEAPAGVMANQTMTVQDAAYRRAKVNRIAGWVLLAVAAIFSIVSVSMHDYLLGEAAGVYARGVIAEAGDRIIALNGLVDDQIIDCLGGDDKVLSLRNDDAYRTHLIALATREWPAETNLLVAARVGGQVFCELALKSHPERFHRMDGRNETREGWERRWTEFSPYLESSDSFVAVARTAFGREGNAVANRLQDTDLQSAWKFYWRIHDDIDHGNFSALFNLREMIRRGYHATAQEKKRIDDGLDDFFKNPTKLRYLRQIVQVSGPIKADPEYLAKLEAEAKQRIARKLAAGEKLEVSPEMMTLTEWNNEMVYAMDEGGVEKAARIARAILTNPKWRNFVPANAVMGSVASAEGDYVASEAFFKTATATTNKIAAVTWNDYADTLMHLGKLDEAEKIARKLIADYGDKFWLGQLTLAEILIAKSERSVRVEVVENGERADRYERTAGSEKLEKEISALLRSVVDKGSPEAREYVRKLRRKAAK